MELDIAQIAIPTMGRDKEKPFFIIGIEENYVYLADGRIRKIENPKRKKIKHINPTDLDGGHVAQKLRNGERVTNSELRKALSVFEKRKNNIGLDEEGE